MNRLSWWIRLSCVLAVVLNSGLLVTARTLTPSHQGLGTHQQLGLPPCTSILLFQMPCPACGMTTSWAHLLRGHVLDAFRVNAGGTLLAMIAIGYLPFGCYFAFTGKGTRRESFSLILGASLLLAICIATAQWLIRL